MRKGISAIIVIILLLMIVVIIAALLYTFSSSVFTSITKSGSTSVTHITESLSSCMKIESINKNEIYLRNCGNGLIKSKTLSLYLDGVLFNSLMVPDSISKGELATITIQLWGVSLGNHIMKLTNPYTELIKTVEAFTPNYNTTLAFSFDEGSGTKLYDMSEYRNHGTLYKTKPSKTECSNPPTAGCPKWVDGKFGKALEFDASNDDYIGIWDNASLLISKNIQIEAWIKTTGSTLSNNITISNRFEAGNPIGLEAGWLFQLIDGKVKFHIGSSTSNWAEAIGSKDLRDGSWHHVMGVYNKSYITVYADGNLEGMIAYTEDIWTGSVYAYESVSIGRRCDVCEGGSGAIFNGTIDELRIYNETPSPYRTIFLRMK